MTRQLTTLSAPIPEDNDPDDYGTWGATTELFHESVDRSVGGYHSISTTGGTTTLTDAQNDVVQLLVSGVLVSNATIYVKARPKIWIVRNATSGAFTLTVRVVGDIGAAVTVTQSRTAFVHTNGTACYVIDLGTLGGTPASVSGPVEYPDGTAGAPAITNTGDTDTGFFFPAADTVAVAGAGSERWRVDANGRFIVGHTAAVAMGDSVNPLVQFATNSSSAALGIARYGADALPAHLRLAKSRNAAIGSHTAVSLNDVVGSVSFDASDGDEFAPIAQMYAVISATPGNNDLPGDLVFATTPDGSKVPAESMRIDKDGFVTFDGDTDTGIRNGGTNILQLVTAGTTRIHIDASGRVIVGTTSSVTTGGSVQGIGQFMGTGAEVAVTLGRYSADASGPRIAMLKSRNAAIAGNTVVQTSDVLGTLAFEGTDGTNIHTGASLAAVIDAAPGLNDFPTRLVFSTIADGASTLTERWRIDSSGRLISSATAAVAAELDGTSLTPAFQLHGSASEGGAGAMLAQWSTTAAEPASLTLARSKSATIGTFTVVASGDEIGSINFNAADGTNFEQAAYIRALVDGTPGADDMPGRIEFGTTVDGAAAATRRMTIDNAGRVVIGDTASIAGASTVGTGLLQVHSTTATPGGAHLTRFSADAVGPVLQFGKSRNATVGSHTVVTAGDVLGYIIATGSDGTDFAEATRITFAHDSAGSPGNNDMGGKITMAVSPDGSETPATQVTVTSKRTSFASLVNFTSDVATISGGAFTATASYMVISPEGGVADNLGTIGGGTAGDLLIIRNSGTADISIVESGNIDNATVGTVTLSNPADTATYIYSGAVWVMLSYSINT